MKIQEKGLVDGDHVGSTLRRVVSRAVKFVK